MCDIVSVGIFKDEYGSMGVGYIVVKYRGYKTVAVLIPKPQMIAQG